MFDFPFFKIRLFVFVVGFLVIMLFMGMCRDAHAQSLSDPSDGDIVVALDNGVRYRIVSFVAPWTNKNLNSFSSSVQEIVLSYDVNLFLPFKLNSSSNLYFIRRTSSSNVNWGYYTFVADVCDESCDSGGSGGDGDGGTGGGGGDDGGDGDGGSGGGDGGDTGGGSYPDQPSGGGDLPSPDIPNESMPSGWGSDGAAVTIDTYSFTNLFYGFVEKTRALPIFSSFSFGNPDTSFGDAYLEFDLGDLGGWQEFDFHVWDDSLSVVGSLLVVVTAVIAIRIVFLKG
jgi:hypothetical protein